MKRITDEELRHLHEKYMAEPELSILDVTPVGRSQATIRAGWERLGLKRKTRRKKLLRPMHIANTKSDRRYQSEIPSQKLTTTPRGHRRHWFSGK